jgi:phosphohistidine phosphatase
VQIVLFRHGPAGRRDVSRWPDDAKRPLTPRGEERTLEAAKGLRRVIGRELKTVLTSPLLRSRRTAEIVAETFGLTAPRSHAELAPGGSYRALIEALKKLGSDDRVILVGHEPDLGRLAGTLLFGAPRPIPLRKAGACVIEFVGEIAPGEGRLTAFLPPRLLRRLSSSRKKV